MTGSPTGRLLFRTPGSRRVDPGEARTAAGLVTTVVTAPIRSQLLRAQRLQEDTLASRGYFVVRTAWRPLPPLRHALLRLRHGPFAELGGTLEADYLPRPEISGEAPWAGGS